MDTLLERPIFIGVIAAVLCLVLLWAWLQSGIKWLLWLGLATPVIGAVLVLVSINVVTEREQLRIWLQEAAAELGAEDYDAVAARIHPAATSQLQEAKSRAMNFEFESVSVTRIHEITLTETATEPQAFIRLNAVAKLTAARNRRTIPRYLELTLYKVGDEWLVYDCVHSDFMDGMRER